MFTHQMVTHWKHYVEKTYRISTRSLKITTDPIKQDEIQITIIQWFC